MNIEGTYVYACPMPDERGPNEPKSSGVFISTPCALGTTLVDSNDYKRLNDLVAAQQEEIVILKKAVTFARVFMTPAQHESLRNLMMLLVGEKP